MAKKSPEQFIEQLNDLDPEQRKVVYLHLKDEFQPVKQRGTKIRDAYDAITYEPQDFDALIEKYGVSPNVMKHHKRFDPFQDRGRVRSRNVAGKRLVWREAPSNDASE